MQSTLHLDDVGFPKINFLLMYFCRMTFWSNLPVRMYILDFRLLQGRDYNCNYIVDGFYFFN